MATRWTTVQQFCVDLCTCEGSAAAMAWPARRASWQMFSSPVMSRWLTVRLRQQRPCWLEGSEELTARSQSAASAGLVATLRRMDKARVSSWYQVETGSSRWDPD